MPTQQTGVCPFCLKSIAVTMQTPRRRDPADIMTFQALHDPSEDYTLSNHKNGNGRTCKGSGQQPAYLE